MKKIKLIAVDTDGVLLEDTFSPILHDLVVENGGTYTAEMERNLFSRPHLEGAKYIREQLKADLTLEDILKTYFERRKEYIKTHNTGFREGAIEFIKSLSNLDVMLVTYGGLQLASVKDDAYAFLPRVVSVFEDYLHYFDQYVCTSNFRPGLKEIIRDMYKVEYDEALFIDDVNTVAEVAKANNVPFIGIGSEDPWSWQKSDMMKTGVKYLYDSVSRVTREVLERVDDEAYNHTVWDGKAASARA